MTTTLEPALFTRSRAALLTALRATDVVGSIVCGDEVIGTVFRVGDDWCYVDQQSEVTPCSPA